MQFQHIVRTSLGTAFLIFLSCSNPFTDSGNRQAEESLTIIAATGSTVLLGPHEAGSAPTLVRFRYNYSLARKETTRQEFFQLMGWLPMLDSSLDTAGSSQWPAMGISWYDAALYCNAKSKEEGLDTVYQWSASSPASEGGVSLLEGLKVNLNADGYRLPTEAEWQLAANAGAGADYPWGNDTVRASQYARFASLLPLPVGTLLPNALGLYDMAGNALEMTGDAWGYLPGTPSIDAAGAHPPRPMDEVVVKGGSWKQGVLACRSTIRKDTYPVYRSSRMEYLGFRVARGVIQHPTWFSGATALDSLTLGRIATQDEVRNFFGTTAVRVVWEDAVTGRLIGIDYEATPPTLMVFPDTLVHHPSFSPDGSHIAFGSLSEGQQGEGQVWIRGWSNTDSARVVPVTGAIPRWWVDPSSKDTFLVVPSSAAPNTDSLSWAGFSTWKLAVHGTVAGAPQNWFGGAWNGGISVSGEWAATGYTRFYVKPPDGAVQQWFTSPSNGKPAGASDQVCNVSMAAQNPIAVLFLDFGATSSSLVGHPYASHEILFVADSSGAITRAMTVPAPWKSWDGTEWSNRPPFAIATGDSGNGPESVLAIRTDAEKTLQIATGGVFLHPALWIRDTPTDNLLANDSLGEYFWPALSSHVMVQGIKIRRYWAHSGSLQGVAIGSSRIMQGLLGGQFTPFPLVNMGISSYYPMEALQLFQDYVLDREDSLSLVVLALDVDLLSIPTDRFYNAIGRSNGILYDKSHGFWIDSPPENLIPTILSKPEVQLNFPIDSAGDIGPDMTSGGWGEPEAHIGPDWLYGSWTWQRSLDILDTLLYKLENRKIRLVAVEFPRNPRYLETGYYSMYGPFPSTADSILTAVDNLAKHHPLFLPVDFYKGGHHDYTDAEARDADHLSYTGAQRLTRELSQIYSDWVRTGIRPAFPQQRR